MTGRVVEVLVSDGDVVKKGDVLVVIESMKMENEIISQHEGRVAGVRVEELETISEDDAMLDIEVER
jgi:biotin carboxyl carrier protein